VDQQNSGLQDKKRQHKTKISGLLDEARKKALSLAIFADYN
jgi:hypothetical protein